MYAVLTGDVVNSRKLGPMYSLDAEWNRAFAALAPFAPEGHSRWEIFRGDSFQTVIQPEHALTAALYLRAWMRAQPFERLADVRIGIGLGHAELDFSRLALAQGEAFERSGKAFDRLGKRRLAIETGTEDVSCPFSQLGIAADAFFREWDRLDAQLWLGRWPIRKTQKTLAEELGITQSAVSQRMQSAQFDGMEALCALYVRLLNVYSPRL